MGTSSSGAGPGDTTPLLPSWALPADQNAAEPNDGDIDNETPIAPAPAAGTVPSDGSEQVDDPNSSDARTTPLIVPRGGWSAAKRRLGSLAAGRGGRGRFAAAGRAYVRARGGAQHAARSATSSRATTARLGGFLSDVASRGVGPALERLGLGRFAGKDAQTIFAAIVDALAPDGADLEQAAAREAIEQTLAGLFEQYVAPDGSIAALESMPAEAIRTAIEASVAASIFNRWLGDLERRLEEKAVTAAQAVKLERDVEAFVRATVKLDMANLDPLSMNWVGAEGQAFVQRIYDDAYSILGGRP